MNTDKTVLLLIEHQVITKIINISNKLGEAYDPLSASIGGMNPSDNNHGMGRGINSGRGRGRGGIDTFGTRGTFSNDNKSLVIKNIPLANCTVAQISECFRYLASFTF